MTDDPDFTALHDRLEPSDGRRGKGGRPPALLGKALSGMAVIGFAAVALAYALHGSGEPEATLATAEPEPWQGTGQGFETMTPPTAAATPQPVPVAAQPSKALDLPSGPSASEQAMMQTLAELQAELEAMREAAAQPQEDGSADQIESLSARITDLAEQSEDMQEALEDAERQAERQRLRAEGLEARLQAAQFGQGVPELPQGGLEAPPLADGEADRLAALEERRAQAEELRQARISSPIVAFGGSASAPNDGSAGGTSGLGPNEDFLRSGARAADVEQAVVIANPSRTVIQGTVIQAVLETAIASDLPGTIRAVVSEDVHSYDGTRVLIPRGSKLIGRYNSQVEATQRRLMVAWDRIITPDGQSVTIAAYGADELGRSGTDGRIDRRLGTRFGSAALVSLIAALPSAAAASVDDPLAAELAEELGGDVEDASRSVLDEYLSVAPTIYVDQGARITVLVDRDLELLG
ncbi:conjugal transfer protein [Rubellimicrobium rubrum]|uniref:Conjugal transfer protein n=1 Tax=Rubellimicrobium rubrum TaxID=2585369 RepID=A0A5C4MYA1_9RHOB|nr:TrbI/VirB10 family protein [Rubellimicrobium rubrum]TNC49578.1 conjugal transfer protein [Rubellimicrobium rubrum]